jgi:hypothetical protein
MKEAKLKLYKTKVVKHGLRNIKMLAKFKQLELNL